jgi:gamma-resorcylate decarboxylase
MHDPEVGAAELERCVTKLGFQGVLINGYAQQGREDNLVYLDSPDYTPFWEAATALDVPVYIHPRVSHQRLMYQGHDELQSAVFGYAPETATHLLRIIYSGVFDRFRPRKSSSVTSGRPFRITPGAFSTASSTARATTR